MLAIQVRIKQPWQGMQFVIYAWENLLRAFDRVNDVTICSIRHVIGYKGELLRKNQGQQASTSSPLWMSRVSFSTILVPMRRSHGSVQTITNYQDSEAIPFNVCIISYFFLLYYLPLTFSGVTQRHLHTAVLTNILFKNSSNDQNSDIFLLLRRLAEDLYWTDFITNSTSIRTLMLTNV